MSLLAAKWAYSGCYAHETDCTHPGRAAPYFGLAGLYAVGIGYGIVQTDRCTQARTRHAMAQRNGASALSPEPSE